MPKYPALILRLSKEYKNSITRDYKEILGKNRFSTLYYYNTTS
jgi:hypothetical protein